MPLTRIVGRTIGRHIRTRPFYLLIVLGALVCAFVIGATIWFLWEQRMAAIQTAGINLQNLSQAVADQTDRILASVEQAEDRLLDHIAFRQGDVTDDRPEMTGSKQLHGVMRDIIGGMSDAYALVLVNASGDLVNFSNDLPVPTLNFADRQYFRFALAHPGTKTFISNAVLSRQTGRSTFFVVRRLTGPDGVFAGLLLGSVEATHLERLFGANALPAGGSVTLFRSNGAMLLRYPAVDTNAMQGRESDFPTSFFGADNGAIRRTGVFDGTNGLTAISDLPRHPLKVAISVAFATVVATWNIAAAWACGIATLACLTTALTIFLAIRQIQGQRRQTEADSSLTVDRERRRADADLAAQHARFGIALDNMSQGLMVFDTTETLLFSNAAALKVFDLDPGALQPGMPFADVIRAVSQVGNLSTDAATVIEFYTKLLRQNVPTKFVLKVPSGRRLAAGFVPYDNGWIITFEDVTESREADDRVLHMAMHDALTGLANRVLLKSWTEKVLADLVKGGDQFAVMCLDLDNFRDVNDMLGHPAGDKLLCEVSRRIQSVTRRSDFVARMGGDEFAIVVRPCDDHSGVVLIASRVVEAIRVPVDIDGQMVQIGTSIGIAMAPADGIDVDTLMKNADLALYRAKSSGRGRYAFFESSMIQHLVERRRIEVELRNALVLDEFELHYQPIVKVATRRVVGFEALIRWRHATRGMVSPSEFIPIAEQNGLIVEIGKWALNRACLEAVSWPGSLKVAVNLSPVQFRTGSLVGTIAAALEASGLAPSRLELEITESTVMQDAETTLVITKDIKALGVRLAMDDFGTGYSSLAYLQRFPFDKVKIDRTFVRDSGQATNLAIIRAVTGIAESMGIETTAEGVETEDQFARMSDEGCHEVQGFLFSRPRPANEVTAMLQQIDGPAALTADRVSNAETV